MAVTPLTLCFGSTLLTVGVAASEYTKPHEATAVPEGGAAESSEG